VKGERKMTKAATKGKRLPGYSTARRRPHLGQKDVILAMPVCPKSQIRGRVVNGHYEPPEIGPDDTNCQLAGGQWWKMCDEKGHDPYWSTKQRVVTRVKYEVDAEGDKIPVEKRIVVEDKSLNVTSVSTSVRLGSGQSVRWKKRYFGYRPISDFGYAEACHLGRCQEPATIVSQPYGQFCSTEHLQMAAADDNEIVLVRDDHEFSLGEERKIQRLRKRQLRNAVDDVDVTSKDGTE